MSFGNGLRMVGEYGPWTQVGKNTFGSGTSWLFSIIPNTANAIWNELSSRL